MINYLLPTKAATVQTLGHPAAGVIGWMDNSNSGSGVAVTEGTALTFAAVWCATRVIAETLATLPCVLYQRATDDGREKATSDPRYQLVHDAPHPEMNAITFFETQTAHMVLSGNSYSKIVWDRVTYPKRFEIRMPKTVTVMTEGDTVRYQVSDPNESIASPNMLHVAGLGGDGIRGWSVVEYARQSLGSAIAADQYQSSLFGNKATPAGILKHPLKLDKPARENLRREWNEIHQGSDNAGKVAIMHGGMEFQAIGMTNEDAQFLQSRNFSIREIARWFRLPPHMLADLQDSSVRANIEQQAIEFIVYSMAPWLLRWQQTLNRKLLTAEERKGMYFEFMLDSLLRGDIESRYRAYATGRQWGWLSVNDILRMENRPIIEGGDIYLQPSNMVEAGADPEPEPMQIPMQQPLDSEDDSDEVPDSLAAELRHNLTDSLAAILDAGKLLRQDIASGRQQIEDSFADANSLLQRNVGGLRELRNEIRRDIDQASQSMQVRGYDAERESLVDACNELLRASVKYAVNVEKSEVHKQAKKVCRGFNFVSWLDEFYEDRPVKTLERIQPAVTCYRKLEQAATEIGQYIADRLAMEHQHDVLEACDGDTDGLMDRLQLVFDAWDQNIETMSF